ncbi:ParA family protein [Paraburkholderia sp. BR10872]|uniref:ParA family protein n=1 Tax=Paraburkholderia sp. BR10872 TaxID=3236989 RepID=UPI0034D26729
MKSLLIISANGNSDRTMLTCLLARHLLRVTHRRLLILDLAGPPRCAQMLASTQHDAIESRNRVRDLSGRAWHAAGGRVCVLNADAVEGLLSSNDPGRTRYYANLRHLLSRAAPRFDVCLIDAPALPDLRAVCAEALVDAVLSPIPVSPECIDCAFELINGTYGIRNVRARLNPALHFLGLLPIVDAPVSMGEAWAKVMETTLREWLIADSAFSCGYAWLPRLTAVGHIGQRLVPRARAAAHDVPVAAASQTVGACLDVLTRRLDKVGNDAVLTLRHAQVCDA